MTEHGLEWVVRPSFVNYVLGLPDGRVEILGGAVSTSRGGYFFPLATASGSSEGVAAGFHGTLNFRGYDDELRVVLAEPRWEFSEGHGRVLTSREAAASGSANGLLFFGTAEPHASGTPMTELMWPDMPLLLSAEAMSMFGNAYAAGTELGSISVSLPPHRP